MLSMSSNDASLRVFRLFRRATASFAAMLAVASVAPVTLAETGGPAPQGDTNDVTAPPQQPAAPPVQPSTAPAAEPPSVAVITPAAPQDEAPAQPQSNAADDYADTDPSALSDFREPLAPYGQWEQDPTYGTIWVPDSAQVGADFAPYQTAGSWGMTDGGDWIWQSDYAWGYIPFHYGRWVWTGGNWGWIPGRRYAPAWVTWRVGAGGYVGWAPLPPAWYWNGRVAVGLGRVPYAAYCFVPTRYAFSSNVSGYVVRDRGMVQSIAATTRPYHPANPSVGRVGGTGRYARMSPSLGDAHIPSSAAPSRFVSHDTRATGYATRSAMAATRASSGYNGLGMRTGTQPSSRTSAWHGSYSHYNRGPAPTLHTPPSRSMPMPHGYPAYHTGAPGYHGAQHFAPHVSRPSYQAPSYAPHGSAPHFGGGHAGGRRR